jgi:hypothetical protein
MLARFWVAATTLAATVAAVPSPTSLNSDLSILINNDLQGEQGQTFNGFKE